MEQIRDLVRGDPAANTAVDLLTDAGGTVYVVGGAVRDVALGKNPKDIDLMVGGLTGDQIEEALTGHGRLDFTGKQFGVYRFKTNNSEVEIAMPRVEYGNTMTDYKIDPNIPVSEDLLRRDFTANAMAVDANTGELIDPYGGMQHINDKTLALANPGGFKDDPTRLLRAITAYAKNDLYPSPETLQAMKEQAEALSTQPPERLQMELDKILTTSAPAKAMLLAEDTGLLKYILPEVSATMGFDQMNPHHDLDVGTHLFAALDAMSSLSHDPDLRMAALLHDIGKPDSFWLDPTAPQGGGGHFYKKQLDDGSFVGEDHEDLGADYAQTLLERLRYPRARIDRIVKLIRLHMFPYFKNLRGARRFLASVDGDPKMAFDLLALREADSSAKSSGQQSDFDQDMVEKARALVQQVIEQQEAVTRKDLTVNGKDLMNLGFAAGPELGQALDKLLDVVIENPELNTREELLRLAQGFLAKQSSVKIGSGEPDHLADIAKQYGLVWDGTKYVSPQLQQEQLYKNWQTQLSDDSAWDYLDQLEYDKEQQDKPEYKNFIAMLPDYKWSWNGYDLDVWPTKSWSAEDHFERTGPMFRELAQGRIYIDSDGYLELFVWGNRGTKKMRDKAVEAVEEWMVHNLGRHSDVVTYEGEFDPKSRINDNFAPTPTPSAKPIDTEYQSWSDYVQDKMNTGEGITHLDDLQHPLDEEDTERARSIHDFTDEEWERMEAEGRVFR
jgi:tRNA nucleotidyltransferase (CCA-adding enzyme)